MLANTPAGEEEATEQTAGLTVVGPASAPDPLEVMANSDEAHRLVGEALGSESSTYRLEGCRRQLNAAEVLQSDMQTFELVGPSVEPPPVLLTAGGQRKRPYV